MARNKKIHLLPKPFTKTCQLDAKTFAKVFIFSIAINRFQSHKGNCGRIIAADLEDHSHGRE